MEESLAAIICHSVVRDAYYTPRLYLMNPLAWFCAPRVAPANPFLILSRYRYIYRRYYIEYYRRMGRSIYSMCFL